MLIRHYKGQHFPRSNTFISWWRQRQLRSHTGPHFNYLKSYHCNSSPEKTQSRVLPKQSSILAGRYKMAMKWNARTTGPKRFYHPTLTYTTVPWNILRRWKTLPAQMIWSEQCICVVTAQLSYSATHCSLAREKHFQEKRSMITFVSASF